MRLEQNLKNVLQNKECQEIFNNYLKTNPFLKFASQRFMFYLEIMAFNNLCEEKGVKQDKLIIKAHLIYARYLKEDCSTDTNIPVTVIEHVNPLTEIFEKTKECEDDEGLIRKGIFDAYLDSWLEHELAEWWKDFEKKAPLNRTKIKTIKTMYPEFRANLQDEKAKPKPTRALFKIESIKELPPVSKAASGRGSFYFKNDPEQSRSNSSDAMPKLGSETGEGKGLKRRKSKLSATSSLSPSTPRKELKLHRHGPEHTPSFFQPDLQTFDEPMENWNKDTVCRWLAYMGRSDLLKESFRKLECTGAVLLNLQHPDPLLMNIPEHECQALLFLIKEHGKENGATISTWNARGVMDWLGDIKVDDTTMAKEYGEVFLQNHINGEMLKDLEVEDMLEMDIAQAHVELITEYRDNAIRLEDSVLIP